MDISTLPERSPTADDLSDLSRELVASALLMLLVMGSTAAVLALVLGGAWLLF